MKSYLLLPRLKIQNANAMSSCYTIGFPAITSWLGFTHALERKMTDMGIKCVKTAIAIHNYSLHTYALKGNNYKSVVISANPLKKKGGKFERPPFIPEGRINLDASVLIELSGVDGDNVDYVKEKIQIILLHMKIAGGDILNEVRPELYFLTDNEQTVERKILYRMMPGYVIIERKKLLEEQEGDDIGRLLKCVQINCGSEKNDDGTVKKWNYSRDYSGWLVPIVVGYRGISSVEKVDGQRDGDYEHQFVEPLVTIGEFKLSCRVGSIEEIMWQYNVLDNLYICSNEN